MIKAKTKTEKGQNRQEAQGMLVVGGLVLQGMVAGEEVVDLDLQLAIDPDLDLPGADHLSGHPGPTDTVDGIGLQ